MEETETKEEKISKVAKLAAWAGAGALVTLGAVMILKHIIKKRSNPDWVIQDYNKNGRRKKPRKARRILRKRKQKLKRECQ